MQFSEFFYFLKEKTIFVVYINNGGEKLWKQKSNLKELPILKMTLSLNSC